MNKKAQKTIDNILSELTAKGYTVNKDLEGGISWLFSKENKPEVFGDFETILTLGVTDFEDFKGKIDSYWKNTEHLYIGYNRSREVKIEEVEEVHKIVVGSLVEHYKKDITDFISNYNKITELTKELEKEYHKLESFVRPKGVKKNNNIYR